MSNGNFDKESQWQQLPPDPMVQGNTTGLRPETSVVTLNMTPHEHFFMRKNASEVSCRNCYSVWIDNSRFILFEGKITGKLEIQ